MLIFMFFKHFESGYMPCCYCYYLLLMQAKNDDDLCGDQMSTRSTMTWSKLCSVATKHGQNC